MFIVCWFIAHTVPEIKSFFITQQLVKNSRKNKKLFLLVFTCFLCSIYSCHLQNEAEK